MFNGKGSIVEPEQAWNIIGNQPRFAIRNMIKALSMSPWLNTKDEERRLEAAKVCLATKNPRYK